MQRPSGAIVVVVGTENSVVRVITWFFVRGQLMRSRSAQAVSDPKNTNRIRLFRIMQAQDPRQQSMLVHMSRQLLTALLQN